MRVLILDNSLEIWKRLFDRLGKLPHVTSLAYSTTLAEARDYIAAYQPHLLVLGMSLPDGNGLDLLKELRAAGSHIRVAVFSGPPELRQASLDLGADWFFDKALEFEQLLSLMNNRTFWLGQGVIVRRQAHV